MRLAKPKVCYQAASRDFAIDLIYLPQRHQYAFELGQKLESLPLSVRLPPIFHTTTPRLTSPSPSFSVQLMEELAIASKKFEITCSRPKKQSSLQRIPWLALASLLFVLACMGASVATIVISDNQTVASWTIQPAVLLAILAALSNVALGIAFSEAVVVTWWTSATNGASLEELHYIWDKGLTNFVAALAAGPTAGKVAGTMLALIIIKVATGPLLQRATRQEIKEVVTEGAIELNVVQHLPSGWIGSVETNSSIVGSGNSVQVTSAWWRKATITVRSPRSYCDGTCEGNVPGAGITYNCSSTTRALDLFTGYNATLFEINTTMSQNSTGAPFLLLTTLYSSAIDDNCTATLTVDTCKIEAAIIEYPVTIQNSTVTLNSDKLNHTRVRSTYTDRGDLPTVRRGSAAGVLRGLDRFSSNFKTRTWQLDPSTFQGKPIGEMFLQTDPKLYTDFTYENCPLKWSSPTDYVLDSMQDFMFRAALRAAKRTDSQTFSVRRAKRRLVFHSVYGYLAAASTTTLFGTFFVLITLQGRWSLGRAVSLSPLETANAFCAPLMERVRCNNITVDGILEDIGQTRVKYVDGLMVVDDESTSSKPLLTHFQ